MLFDIYIKNIIMFNYYQFKFIVKASNLELLPSPVEF